MENEGHDHALVADAEAPTEFALMANTESKVFDNSLYSNDCKKNNDSLNSKIKDLTGELSEANNYIYHYKLAIAQLEDRLVEYKEREVKYIEKIRTLEMYRESNLKCIKTLDKELETLKLEKDGLDGKLAGLLKASKNLDNLIESQRSNKVKEGVGYNAVPPPAADLYLSPKKDLSWTGLPEFVDDTVTDYSRPSPTVASTSIEGQNKNPSTSEDVASPNTHKPFVKSGGHRPHGAPVRPPHRSASHRPHGASMRPSHRPAGHRPHGAPVRPPHRSASHRPHGASMRPSHRPAGHRPHGPLMNPMRPNINDARPNRSFFIQAHSYETRPFLKSSVVKTQYRAPWVPTINRNNPPVNRKFSTGRRNFPTVNRKFPTASRKFTTGSTKIHTADIGRKRKAVNPSACWVWNPSQNLSNKEEGLLHGYDQKQLRVEGKRFQSMTFEEIKAKFVAVWKQVEDFIPMGSKEEAERLKRKGLNLEQDHVKKQNTSEEDLEIEKSTEEISEEKMKEMMQLVPVEDVYVQALQVKHPIIDWKEEHQVLGRIVENKMHKEFPLLVRKLPLPEGTSHCLKKNATARRNFPLPEEECHCQKKSVATARSLHCYHCQRETVEHKDHKKRNKIYYPRFIKVIIHHFMSKDPSIPRRNKFGALLPIELTNEEIRNSIAYKEYYAVATRATPPKPKASVWKTRSSFDTTITPLTATADPRLTTFAKGKQAAKASKAKSLSALSEVAMTEAQQLNLVTKRSLQQTHISQASGSGTDEGTGSKPEVPDVPTDESEEELSWNSTDDEGNDEGKDGDGDGDDDDEDDDGEEGDDDDDQEVERDAERMMKRKDLGLNVGREEGHNEDEEEDELYKDVNINQRRGIQATLEVKDSHVTLTPVNPDGMESIFKTTSQIDVHTPTYVAPLPMTAPTMTPSTIVTITITSQAPIPPTTAPSTIIQDLPNFGSLFGFDNRLRTLEANFFEFMQTNQFAGAVSAILGIVQRYMDQRMNEAVKVAVQIQSDHLCDEAQKENDEFLKTDDENMQKIIKEQVKEQVKMELKKILIEKIKGNKSIQRSDEQRNLYKALVEAYESDKIILDTYRETVTLKRRHDNDADKDEEPTVGPDRGSKRRREGKDPDESDLAEEPMQTTFQMEEPSHLEFDTCAEDQPIVQSSQYPEWFFKQQKPPTPDRDWNKTLSAIHGRIQPWISKLAKETDSRSSFNELMNTPLDFSNFLINQLKVDTLTPELLVGPTYELMKGSCKSLIELKYHLEEVFKATTDQLDWINPEGQQYPHNLLKSLPLILNNRGRRVIPFKHFINNDLEYLCGGASSRKYTTSITKTKAAYYGHIKRIIAVIELKIVEWHNYKHLDWITMRRVNDKLYKFKEGNFKRLRIQDTEDMLLLLVQGKLTNLTVEERFAFNVSLRMFMRSIVIQRCVEDLQLGVKSYQTKLNLTKSDSYRFDLKRKEAYTTYSNPRGFIYQNKDKKNRLMQIDELHKFSDGTLTDVRTTLDDRLKGIQKRYLPQSIWRKSDKERAVAMIQAIDKRLKTRRIMRSLERSILTDLQVTPTKLGRMTKPYSSHHFIANCSNA
nr:hypothetical protein [Tanacetum cinerariifolium]